MTSITGVFVRRPVLAVALNLVLVLFGARALFDLPLQQYPRIESSSVQITTGYWGASAETVRGFVTTPIERAVSGIGGLDFVSSTSRANVSSVTVQLALGQDSTRALAEISARLAQVRSQLPAKADPPWVEVRRADRPWSSFYLSFTSRERSTAELTDWLARSLQPEFATLPGVQRVTIDGGHPLALRVWIEPERLAALGLTPGDVQLALERNNYLATVGQAQGNLVQVNLLTNTDLRSLEEFQDLIVADREGALVRLSDVARIELGAEEPDAVAKVDAADGVYLSVWSLPGSNEIELAHRLRREMARLAPALPPDIDMQLQYDATAFMEDSLAEVSKTLLETIGIVGLVVFLFLGSLRSALVPLVAMPISLVGAAAVMAALGFSLNLLTMLALVLSVGLVVDDAIVVVEDVERHLRAGRSRTAAALEAGRELLGPIVSMTVTLIAVYAPIGFQGGLTGALFLEFAITLAAAVLISAVVAVTLSPVMSAYLLPGGHRQRGLVRHVQRGFERVRAPRSSARRGAWPPP